MSNQDDDMPASIRRIADKVGAPVEGKGETSGEVLAPEAEAPKRGRGRPKKEPVEVDPNKELTLEELMEKLVSEIPPPGEPWLIDGEYIRPGDWVYSYRDHRSGLPKNFPVRVLGKSKEGIWCLDPLGGMLHITKQAGKGELDHLFSPCNDYLMWAWPQKKPIEEEQEQKNGKMKKVVVDWEVDNYKAELVRTALFRAAGMRLYFDPINKVRGRGCWLDEDGEVIFHAGTRIYYKGDWHLPGEINGLIYTTKPAIGRPTFDSAPLNFMTDGMSLSAETILNILKTWAWERPEIDPYLAFGFLVSCRFGAALKVRPAFWLSGGTGAGKSEFYKFLRWFMDECLIAIEKASAASIYQNLQEDCLPVSLDEQENAEDRRVMKSILDLILVSFSGGSIGKGGQDGVPVNYTLRSSFFMSGIVQASMATANENRMISLMIHPLPPEKAGGLQPEDKDRVKAASADLFGRVIKDFGRLNATFDRVRRYLALQGYEGRHQDTYGMLIACAHVAMFDHDIEDGASHSSEMGLEWWGKRLPRFKKKANWHDLFNYIMETPIDAYRSTKHPNVEAIIQQGMLQAGVDEGPDERLKEANSRLGLVGLVLYREYDANKPATEAERYELFIPNRHQGLAAWLRETIWGGGSGETGAWSGVLKQIPHPVGRPDTVKRAIYGKSVVGVKIDLREAMKAFE